MAEPVFTTPLHGRWAAMDARLVDVAGWRLPERFGDGAREARALTEAVVLVDDTPRGKLLVQGEAAGAVVAAVTGAAAPAPGEVASGDPVSYGLRPDLLQVATAPEDVAEVRAALERAAEAEHVVVTVTDVTHGRFEFRLVGPAAPELLSKVCGLDVGDEAFAAGARETSLARIKALVVRADVPPRPGYRLLGGRALGAYVWDTLMQAGADLGIEPAGIGTLKD